MLGPLPPEVRELIRLGFRNGPPLTAARAAAELGLSRRSLTRYLRAAGLPGTAKVLRICRLLVAAYLLALERAAVEQAAHRAGFGRTDSLRYHMRAYFSRLPSRLRAQGASSWRELLEVLPDLCRPADMATGL